MPSNWLAGITTVGAIFSYNSITLGAIPIILFFTLGYRGSAFALVAHTNFERTVESVITTEISDSDIVKIADEEGTYLEIPFVVLRDEADIQYTVPQATYLNDDAMQQRSFDVFGYNVILNASGGQMTYRYRITVLAGKKPRKPKFCFSISWKYKKRKF